MRQELVTQPSAGVAVAMSALVLAVFSLAASAFGASTPRLHVAAVKEVALHAVQFRPSATTAYVPDTRLTVERVRLSDAGKQLVWEVDLHATIVVFPCKLPPPGAAAPGCTLAKSRDALVRISDASGRVLSLTAVT